LLNLPIADVIGGRSVCDRSFSQVLPVGVIARGQGWAVGPSGEGWAVGPKGRIAAFAKKD
jgi:hypothetical protein